MLIDSVCAQFSFIKNNIKNEFNSVHGRVSCAVDMEWIGSCGNR